MTIPIVFAAGFDPVDLGLVRSLHRPGGNLTGASMLNLEVVPKRLQLLHEFAPAATAVALLVNPSNPNAATQTRDLQAAAHTLGLQSHILHASSDRDFDAVFAKFHELRAGGLVIGADAFFNTRSAQLAALALRHAVPVAYQYREFTAAGGLMSYGGSITDAYRQTGIYAGRILKGEKRRPSTKLELFLNLKTAKIHHLCQSGVELMADLVRRRLTYRQYGRTNPISTFRSKTYAFAYPCGSEIP